MLTGKQLRQYLAYRVHGIQPESEPAPKRKPMAKARKSARREMPVRSEPYKRWIRTMPSLISGRGPCDACHTGEDGGMGQKAGDLSCVPMTRREHQEYHQIGKAAFALRHGVDFAREVRRLNGEFLATCTKSA